MWVFHSMLYIQIKLEIGEQVQVPIIGKSTFHFRKCISQKVKSLLY